MTKTVEERLEDPDYRGHFQHCRGWDELDRLHDDARDPIKGLREALKDLSDAARSSCDANQHPALTEALAEADALIIRAEAKS